mmetsp:Transcript_79073/g.157981  ORF Transcript_79073/g.157981 Transcript_79073/m.157981 type:complete len:231 (+) Transcript_79073:126-818(+)
MACAFLSACATSMELALLCSTLVTGMGSHPRPRARDKRSVGASKSILSCRIAASPPPSMPFRGSSRSGAQGTSSNRSLRRKHPHHSFFHESAKARPACAETRSALTAPACVVSNPLHAPAAAPGGLPGLLVIAAVAALALAARLCLAVRMASAERFGGRRLRNRTNRRSGCRAAAAAVAGAFSWISSSSSCCCCPLVCSLEEAAASSSANPWYVAACRALSTTNRLRAGA